VQVLTAPGTPLSGITQVAVDGYDAYNACAIGAGGAVWCWGYGSNNVLGSGSTANENYASPVLAAAAGSQFTGVTQIAVGSDHICAIVGGGSTGGSLYCWGGNSYGELGLGSTSSTPTLYPTYVANLMSTVLSVAASYYSTCALTIDQTVWCWGYNGYGIIGNGSTSPTSVPTPSQVQTTVNTTGASPFGGVAAISLGSYSTACAVKASGGGLWCWGEYSGSTNNYLPTHYVQGSLGVSNVFLLCSNGSSYDPSFVDDTGAMNFNGSVQSPQISCP
jgi:alpha-tubulin suppressor-like RCC1 family protein